MIHATHDVYLYRYMRDTWMETVTFMLLKSLRSRWTPASCTGLASRALDVYLLP